MDVHALRALYGCAARPDGKRAFRSSSSTSCAPSGLDILRVKTIKTDCWVNSLEEQKVLMPYAECGFIAHAASQCFLCFCLLGRVPGGW